MAPTLAFKDDAENAMPDEIEITISADKDVYPTVISPYVLTTGYDFSGTEIILLENSSKWVRSVEVNEIGNIVLNVVPQPFILKVK